MCEVQHRRVVTLTLAWIVNSHWCLQFGILSVVPSRFLVPTLGRWDGESRQSHAATWIDNAN